MKFKVCGLTLLLSTEHSCCVTMKMMMSKEQLTLSTPQKHWFLSPVTLKDPELFHHLPYPPSLNANQEAHVDVLFTQGNKQNPTDRWIFTANVRQTHWREASSLSLLSVCLSDRPPYHDCTPRDCSERLPFW